MTLKSTFTKQKTAAKKYPHVNFMARRMWLEKLNKALEKYQQDLIDAVDHDFGGRSKDETRLAEIFPLLTEIKETKKHLASWMKPEKRHVGIWFQPAEAKVVYQPMGVVGIIVPWNYPIFLALSPLISALAAGNRVMLKLSEYTNKTNTCLKQVIDNAFNENEVAIVTGDAKVASDFSSLPFDHLLFTGATEIGKKVMRAASENLTPVTLELGGKSPVIVTDNHHLEQAAERIVFGKCLNAGQTCVAPDYVLCEESLMPEFLKHLKKAFNQMYPDWTNTDDYTSIIHDQHYKRLQDLLTDAQVKGAKIVKCAEGQNSKKRMPLHIVTKTKPTMRIVQEEIFGPILPVIPFVGLDEAIRYVNDQPRPLALYYFDDSRYNKKRILKNTHAGGVCINDCVTHVAQFDLPFGGVGASGMGRYHGKEGFMTFSNQKSVFIKGHFNSSRLIYPPFGRWMHRFLYRLVMKN